MANFTVQETKVLDPSGKEWVGVGGNFNSLNWVWPRELTQDADLITKVWKFNFIRLNCFVLKTDSPYPQYKDNNDIDKAVKTFTSRGVVCQFEAHDKTGDFFTQTSKPNINELKSWFKNLAIKYKDNPYVWFNVMNEPGLITPYWLEMHEEVIKVIRDTGNENIITCDGAAWGQDSNSWDGSMVNEKNSAILTYGPALVKKYKNINFSIHVYEQWSKNGEAKLKDYVERVRAKSLNLMFGEFGMWNNSNDCKSASTAMMKLAKQYNMTRAMWAWDGGDWNDLTEWNGGKNTSGGWQIDKKDGTKPTNLSWLGNLVWDDNYSIKTTTPTPIVEVPIKEDKISVTPNPVIDQTGGYSNKGDLVVTEVKVKEGGNWRKGTPLTFEVNVKNQGTESTVSTWLGISLFTEAGKIGWAGNDVEVPAGANVIITSSSPWTPTTSSFTLFVVIDDQNKINETDESNNYFTKVFD